MQVTVEKLMGDVPGSATSYQSCYYDYDLYRFDLGKNRVLFARCDIETTPTRAVLWDLSGAHGPEGWFYAWPEAAEVVAELQRRGFTTIEVCESGDDRPLDPSRLKAVQ
jgi:hypothetical protein